MFFANILLILILVFFLSMSLKVVREDERVVIFRLGRLFKITGPGLVVVLPIVDKIVKVNLSEKVPGWRGLSNPELEEKIKDLVFNREIRL